MFLQCFWRFLRRKSKGAFVARVGLFAHVPPPHLCRSRLGQDLVIGFSLSLKMIQMPTMVCTAVSSGTQERLKSGNWFDVGGGSVACKDCTFSKGSTSSLRQSSRRTTSAEFSKRNTTNSSRNRKSGTFRNATAPTTSSSVLW